MASEPGVDADREPATATPASAAEDALASATTDRAMLERLCRLCERAVCEVCPVAGALRDGRSATS